MGNTSSRRRASSPPPERQSPSPSPERTPSVEAYSYEDMRAIFNAIVSELNFSFGSDQQSQLPTVECPAEQVENIESFLQQHLAAKKGAHILFIPLFFNERWISVMLTINDQNQIRSVGAIDSDSNGDGLENFLRDALVIVYTTFNRPIHCIRGYHQAHPDPESSAVLALANANELLNKVYFPRRHTIQSIECSSDSIVSLQRQQHRLFNEYSPIKEVFNALMRSDVRIDPKVLATALPTSSTFFKAVMQSPARVSALQEASLKKLRIVSSAQSFFMLLPNGQVYGCGKNEYGELGLGDTKGKVGWTPLKLPGGVAVKKIIAGNRHTFLLSTSDQWYACGNNESGQLGLGDNRDRNAWTPVALPAGVAVQKIISVGIHTFLLSTSGEWYACGFNGWSLLGLGDSRNRVDWTPITLLAGVAVKKIIAGNSLTFLLSTSGQWYVCGNNRYGQLGLGDGLYRVDWTPITLPAGVAVKKIIAGSFDNTFLLSTSGEWYACRFTGEWYAFGFNGWSPLGQGDTRRRVDWTPLTLPDGVEVKKIIAGNNHTFLLSTSGQWYVCGNNRYGQLGLGDGRDRFDWTPITLPAGVAVKKIIAGNRHTFLLSTSGQWYACGANEYGELGLGDTRDRVDWTPVALPVGESFEPLPSLFDESVRAVQAYCDSDKSFESMRTLVDALSADQLLLVPYHLSDNDASQLNYFAYTTIESLQTDAKKSADFSVLRHPSLFSASAAANSYDPDKNYLVLYKQKRILGHDDSDCANGFKW